MSAQRDAACETMELMRTEYESRLTSALKEIGSLSRDSFELHWLWNAVRSRSYDGVADVDPRPETCDILLDVIALTSARDEIRRYREKYDLRNCPACRCRHRPGDNTLCPITIAALADTSEEKR